MSESVRSVSESASDSPDLAPDLCVSMCCLPSQPLSNVLLGWLCESVIYGLLASLSTSELLRTYVAMMGYLNAVITLIL